MKQKYLMAVVFLCTPVAILTIGISRHNRIFQTARAEALFTEMQWEEPTPGLEGLVKMGAAAVPTLQEALKDPLQRMKCRAAIALARIGPAASNAVSDLDQNLEDDDTLTRDYTMQALTAIGTCRADLVPKILPRLGIWNEAKPAADLLDKIEQERKAAGLPPAYSDAYGYAMAFARAATPAVQLRALPKLPQQDERSLAVFKDFSNDTNGWVREETRKFLNDHNIVLPDTTNSVQTTSQK
jgi:hypothetical protein